MADFQLCVAPFFLKKTIASFWSLDIIKQFRMTLMGGGDVAFKRSRDL